MDKRLLAFALSLPLLLTACGSRPTPGNLSLDEHLKNPLYAEQYWSDRTQMMVDLLTNDSKMMQDQSLRKKVDADRLSSLSKAQEQTALRRQGTLGRFVPVMGGTQGLALLLDRTLFFSQDFGITPGPSLHVYLTNAVDPRDVKFPDASSKDLGELRSAYGDQSYAAPEQGTGKDELRTVVIWDTTFKTVFAFAQLSK